MAWNQPKVLVIILALYQKTNKPKINIKTKPLTKENRDLCQYIKSKYSYLRDDLFLKIM